MLNAYLESQVNLADELVTLLQPVRHTFASQLLQDGASVAYGRDQLGRSSISVAGDLYGRLVPGANIAWVDRLDREISQEQTQIPRYRRWGMSRNPRRKCERPET